MPDPPSPKITYGEFPFHLVYEIDGMQVIVEDSLICEYNGIGMDEGRGKFRQWKKYLASGNERISLLRVNDYKEIYYDPGPDWYYMGDVDETNYDHAFPNASYIEEDGQITRRGEISEKELVEQYNIKLLGWEPSPPIENIFE
ncbi:hypothetical protein U6B65_05615 [Oscillospiraceae bacterium MB08-C2-2]|nr:hypothetical protein U6B65_05615 [Oscillospiraceae bacterium MB08-C2-2]